MNTTAAISESAQAVEPESSYAEQLGLTLEAIERLELSLHMVIEYEGFSYQSDFPGIEYQTGERGGHRCDYTITLRDGLSLGTIEVSRNWPFRESELRMLECCIADFYLRLDRSIQGSQRP
ncbi:MAG: hypothetical protein QNI86_03630 [Halieaceae bacterium]|nr:hypothetical protein [Halieaceae bacterium]